MNVMNMRETKGEDFTVFHFDSIDSNHDIMFRLRNGHGTIKNMTTSELILSDTMWGFDGICNIADVQKWAKKHGVDVNLLVQ